MRTPEYVERQIPRARAKLALERMKLESLNERRELTFSQLMGLEHGNERFTYAFRYYTRRLPQVLRDHRHYFEQDGRSFGNAAFHALWYLLILERHPRRMLEIGVYRGQIISLWQLIANHIHLDIDVMGVSPLTNVGDQVSRYVQIDYESDIEKHYRHFGLGSPHLTRALSTDAAGLEVIRSGGPWDVIYIDGGHDYEVVRQDFLNALDGLAPDGLIVMDDASLFLPFDPPSFTDGGHPGPSRVAKELGMTQARLIGSVGHNVVFARNPSD
jgi:predicted O-methyltransferase YrrM